MNVEELIITVTKQMDGYTFSLSPKMRKKLLQAYSEAVPRNSLFVAFDVKEDFEQMLGSVLEHTIPILTGLEKEKFKEIKYVDVSTGDKLHQITSANVA